MCNGYVFAPDHCRDYFIARDRMHYKRTGECPRKHTEQACPVCGKKEQNGTK